MTLRKFCARCDRIVDLSHTHRTKDTRPSARKRGYDLKWERERERYLKTFPLCHGCGAPATQVHHRDGRGPKGPLGFDWGNLEGLCASCHSQRTAELQPGGFAA